MKLSFVSAQSQNSVIFSPTQSYAVQSFNNTSKSTDTATQQLANQQKQQLKGQNNFVSFQNIQINSPPNNKMNENKQLSLSYKSLLLQSPNQTTQISTVSGRDNFQKNLSNSFTKSPKQVTFSDDKNDLQKFTQDVINPYNLREARQRQQYPLLQQQQQLSKSDKILVEENIQNDNSNYSNKNALFLIPKSQIQNSSEELTQESSEKQSINQNYTGFKYNKNQNDEYEISKHNKGYFLSNNCVGERSVIKEVTEEDSDIKAKINHEQNSEFEESSPKFDLLQQSLMNKEYMEFKNQQQSVFKLPTAQENIDKQEQIKNVIVGNKKISMIKNNIKNRLAELEKRIEDANKNNGELHEQLDKIDNHNLQESTSELEDFSNNNSKFMKSFSQNKDIDSNKITPRISNNDEQHQLKSNQINQNTQLFQKTIKYENLNQNPYLNQQSNNFATQKNIFENRELQQNIHENSLVSSNINNSRRHSQEGKQNVIDQSKQFRNNDQNRENTQTTSRDDQSNISALVRDFSHIADNKKVNDSSYHNNQNSFSIASDYKKQFIPFQENSKPIQQSLPQSSSGTNVNQQAQNLPPYHHHHNFSFRDRNINSENDRYLSNIEQKKEKNDDEFTKYYINVQQKIKEYKENSINSSKQLNQSNENSQEQIRQELLNNSQNKYIQSDQLKLNDNKDLIRSMAGCNNKNDGINGFRRGYQLDKFMRDQQIVQNKRTQQNYDRSRKSYQKSKSHSKDLNDQNELNNSNLSKTASLNRSSSELKTMLNDDLNRSLNKHQQLKQIKDQIVDEIGKQKLRLSFEKQGKTQILNDSMGREQLNSKSQQNNSCKIQIYSNCNNLSSSFTNKSDYSNQVYKQNNQQTHFINQDANTYQNILQSEQDSKQQTSTLQKQHSQNSFTQQQTPSSSSQRNNSFKVKSHENQINNSSNNISKQNYNNYLKDIQNNSSRSALETHNFTDRLENGNIPSGQQQENVIGCKNDTKELEKQTFLENVKDQANHDKNQYDFKENKLYQAVKNQLQEKADSQNIANKSTAQVTKLENKPLQEKVNDVEYNNSKLNHTNNSYNQSDVSFSQNKGRLLVRSIADFQVGSENSKNLVKEQVVFKKKINEIQQEINEKESQMKLQNKITECINIYQNQKKNEQMLQASNRQRSPYNSSNNFFNSSLNNQQYLNKTTQNTLTGLNHTDLEIPSQIDQNKMTNLSMSVSFASPNQRSLSRSKKSVRFLNPQDDKQLVNSIEKAKKAKYQEKVKNIISQKVHNWLNKPSKPQMVFNDSKYRINNKQNNNNNNKQLNSSSTLPKNCYIPQNIYQK
ncbi:hypothetical protein TTHERM_00013130 (macronuclear) [Tetrahymena thermophila SB210]|uniref:Uncharacterized protein n=1 Tax=Tetrahymena thermophila (strain SB210) TaxID=312017 RepID=Q22RS5_TETTS|nr:hypothetical protein TTHERM_00013130 [Tetrahymena thermophila SB210]EAR88047.1 hypothetical protein TTHERM_00013130 [Tetrahymena thermophila SB210]|eukprot:XP_001008292.1 hypothetical protein TTHERM_00013130 [Tetrahymena thermophila SB210]